MLFYNDFKTSLIEGRNPFHLKTRVGRSWRIALALENLEGGTHQMSPPKPAWWSFDGSSSSFPPVAAGDYMKELGLSDLDITDAKAAGYAVVVEVPTESFGEVEFYKPCALDNFIEDSNFCPDCTTAPHGWTRHRVTNQKGHPELISEPMQYSEFTGSQVNIYLIPYHAPSSGTTP